MYFSGDKVLPSEILLIKHAYIPTLKVCLKRPKRGKKANPKHKECTETQTTETSKRELIATASPKFQLHLIRALLHRDTQESEGMSANYRCEVSAHKLTHMYVFSFRIKMPLVLDPQRMIKLQQCKATLFLNESNPTRAKCL